MVTTPMPAPMISARAQPGRSLKAFMDREDSSHDRAARMSFVDLQHTPVPALNDVGGKPTP